MSNNKMQEKDHYNSLVSQISDTYIEGRQRAVAFVNRQITDTYWKVGEQIVEYEQRGRQRAEYGSK